MTKFRALRGGRILAILLLFCGLAASGKPYVSSIRARALPHGQQGPGDPYQDAFATALRLFNGVPFSDCQTNNPQEKTCVIQLTAMADPETGLASFGVSSPDPNEPGGALVLLGRLLDGSWGYWFGTQQGIYQRLALPGGMLVCADGNGARLRAAPNTDAEILDVLPDLTLMTGDRFVLTQPGDIATLAVGAGWYHLSAPETGWISSTLATDAGRGNCSLRDIMTAGR